MGLNEVNGRALGGYGRVTPGWLSCRHGSIRFEHDEGNCKATFIGQ